jgi:hypothetical protein
MYITGLKESGMKVFKVFATALFISIVLHGANAGFWGRGKKEAKRLNAAPLDQPFDSGQEDLIARYVSSSMRFDYQVVPLNQFTPQIIFSLPHRHLLSETGADAGFWSRDKLKTKLLNVAQLNRHLKTKHEDLISR